MMGYVRTKRPRLSSELGAQIVLAELGTVIVMDTVKYQLDDVSLVVVLDGNQFIVHQTWNALDDETS
jgi:hypothetical protein